MKALSSIARFPSCALVFFFLGILGVRADTTPPSADGSIVVFNSTFDISSLETAGSTVSHAADGKDALDVKFALGEPFPKVAFTGPGEGWNLSGYTGVQITVTNTGTVAATVALRVDNPGDWHNSPWDTESAALAPGETQTIKVVFGQSFGYQPSYALDPAHVSSIQVFLDHPTAESSISITDLKAFK